MRYTTSLERQKEEMLGPFASGWWDGISRSSCLCGPKWIHPQLFPIALGVNIYHRDLALGHEQVTQVVSTPTTSSL
jgi:hypothetical protein